MTIFYPGLTIQASLIYSLRLNLDTEARSLFFPIKNSYLKTA